jgi:hypothetical protein
VCGATHPGRVSGADDEDDRRAISGQARAGRRNQQLIETVFAELDEREPEGFTYKFFRLDDGVSLIHVVIEHDVDEPDSLQAVPAFQAFVAGIADRCDVPPVAIGATIVGGYR